MVESSDDNGANGTVYLREDRVTPLKRDVIRVLDEYDMIDTIVGEKILNMMARHEA